MTDVQVSNARRIGSRSAARLGATAGLAWSVLFAVLFGVWEPPALIALLIACPALGAIIAMMAAGTLVSIKRLTAIGLGLCLVPFCAFLFGFFHTLLAFGFDALIGSDESVRGVHDATVGSLIFAVMCTYASVLSGFAFLTIPGMCLTMVWLQHRLRSTSGRG